MVTPRRAAGLPGAAAACCAGAGTSTPAAQTPAAAGVRLVGVVMTMHRDAERDGEHQDVLVRVGRGNVVVLRLGCRAIRRPRQNQYILNRGSTGCVSVSLPAAVQPPPTHFAFGNIWLCKQNIQAPAHSSCRRCLLSLNTVRANSMSLKSSSATLRVSQRTAASVLSRPPSSWRRQRRAHTAPPMHLPDETVEPDGMRGVLLKAVLGRVQHVLAHAERQIDPVLAVRVLGWPAVDPHAAHASVPGSITHDCCFIDETDQISPEMRKAASAAMRGAAWRWSMLTVSTRWLVTTTTTSRHSRWPTYRSICAVVGTCMHRIGKGAPGRRR